MSCSAAATMGLAQSGVQVKSGGPTMRPRFMCSTNTGRAHARRWVAARYDAYLKTARRTRVPALNNLRSARSPGDPTAGNSPIWRRKSPVS